MGVTSGNSHGEMSTIGIDFDSWTEETTLSADNGAVFWMSPDNGPSEGDIVLGQFTIPNTVAEFTFTGGLQGRSLAGDDWKGLMEITVVTSDITETFEAFTNMEEFTNMEGFINMNNTHKNLLFVLLLIFAIFCLFKDKE